MPCKRLASVIVKAMHLEETLVINVPFVIPIFWTSLQALYNHGFAKFLQNFEANLTQNKLLAPLYNKINDLITKNLLLLG
jgi:hypothetical protein